MEVNSRFLRLNLIDLNLSLEVNLKDSVSSMSRIKIFFASGAKSF